MFAREDLPCLAMPVRRNGETLAQLLPRFDLVVASTPVDDEFTDEVIRSWWEYSGDPETARWYWTYHRKPPGGARSASRMPRPARDTTLQT
jgi:hypothetical protein